MHHFEVVASEIRGDGFQIVLRNSITGHQMTVVGSALGLSMEEGRRVDTDYLRRVATTMAGAVNQVDAATALGRPRRRVTPRTIEYKAELMIPADFRRELERRVKEANNTAKAAIKRMQAQIKKAGTPTDASSVLKRLDQLNEQVREMVRRSGSSAKRRATSTTRRTTTTTRRAAKSADQTSSRKPKRRARVQVPSTGNRPSVRRRRL